MVSTTISVEEFLQKVKHLYVCLLSTIAQSNFPTPTIMTMKFTGPRFEPRASVIIKIRRQGLKHSTITILFACQILSLSQFVLLIIIISMELTGVRFEPETSVMTKRERQPLRHLASQMQFYE